MWRYWLAIVGFGILVGCNQITPVKINAPDSRASIPPITVAWGERIDLGTNARKIEITYPGNLNGTQVIDVSQRFYDIPAPPIDTEALGTATSVSLEEYNTALNPTLYTQRGTLHVKNANNQEIATYTPYGSVVNGQIGFLASISSQSCNEFNTFVTNRLGLTPIAGFAMLSEDKFSIFVPGAFSLCYGSILVGQQTTNLALDRLSKILSQFSGYVPVLGGTGFVTDKNTVFNLLQTGVWAYDPTCKEIELKLDPFATLGFGFDQITTTKLKADLNITAASKTGLGVNVNIIGGGVDAADTFSCIPNYNFTKHDTHVKSLIKTIAKDATITPYTACNSSGVCKGSELGKALMKIVASNPTKPNIINMSLGSALPNNIMYALLELLRVRHNMPVFTSGGNARRAPAQYPASYSSGVAVVGQPSLANVISVASVGWYNGGYRIATFNTRANADVFTQGVNLCPDSILGKRCLSQAFPANLGITGSSFSAPVAVGLMALMIEQKGGKIPTDLHACVRNNRKTDSVSGIRYAALMNQACP
jgi:Subtilase family